MKNVTGDLAGERFMCQIHDLKERKGGRCYSEWEKMRKKLMLCP